MHYRLLVNTAFSKSKHGFIFLAGNYVGTNDQFEVTNYSWISILLKSQKTYGLELDQIHDNKFSKQTSCHISDRTLVKRQRSASVHEFMQWSERG